MKRPVTPIGAVTHRIVHLLLLTSAMLAGAAQAQASGSVTISDLRYQLFDLDPNDGITPSLTWESSAFALPSYALATSHIEGDPFQTVDYMRGQFALELVSAELLLDTGRSASAMHGALENGLVLQLGSAIVSDQFYGNFAGEIHSGYIGFVLSPMTAVTFRSDVALGADIRAPSPGQLSDSVSLMSELIVNFNGPGAAYTHIAQQNWSSSSVGSAPPGDTALEMTLSNTRAYALSNELALYGAISVASAASPVPEPSSWVMLAAGLALLTRRRSCRARAPRISPAA